MDKRWWFDELFEDRYKKFAHNNFEEGHVLGEYIDPTTGEEWEEMSRDKRKDIPFLVFCPWAWVGGFIAVALFVIFLPFISAAGCGLYADKKARDKQLKTRLIMVLLCSLGAFTGATAIQHNLAPSMAEAPAVERVAN